MWCARQKIASVHSDMYVFVCLCTRVYVLSKLLLIKFNAHRNMPTSPKLVAKSLILV